MTYTSPPSTSTSIPTQQQNDANDGHDDNTSTSFHFQNDASSATESLGPSTNRRGLTEERHAQEKDRVLQMSLKETKDAWTWKFSVLLLMLATAGFVSAATFKFLDRAERENFNEHFADAVAVFDSNMKNGVDILFDGMHSFATWMTGEAMDRNAAFPYVTISTFELEGQSIRTQTRAERIVFAPLVTQAQKLQWERYSTSNQGWIEKGRSIIAMSPEKNVFPTNYINSNISSSLIEYNGEDGQAQNATGEVMAPYWESTPPPFNPAQVNVDLMSENSDSRSLFEAVSLAKEPLFSDLTNQFLYQPSPRQFAYHDAIHEDRLGGNAPSVTPRLKDYISRPHAILLHPIFEQIFNTSSSITGFLYATIGFDRYLTAAWPHGLYVGRFRFILRNSCGRFHTFELIDNDEFLYLGEGDLHDKKYDDKRMVVPFYAFQSDDTPFVEGHCFYSFHVYPTQQLEGEFRTGLPVLMTLLLVVIFCAMIALFLVYDYVVLKVRVKIVGEAARSNAIVSSIFPDDIRAQLADVKDGNLKQSSPALGTKQSAENVSIFANKAIAEFYPSSTIMIAEISNFAAWSSTHEPSQVFHLLEIVYATFDKLAQKRNIFKVQTVGNCYVAVKDDHAVVMTRFAKDCLGKISSIINKLEVSLGPDTSDLSIRIGLHSGPITAGILRGVHTRFQLLGDTLETAARMESTGEPGMIHVSKETVDLLKAAGKSLWVAPRKDQVIVSGLEEEQTYWVSLFPSKAMISKSQKLMYGTNEFTNPNNNAVSASTADKSRDRLVRWNVEVLLRLLKQVEARRDAVQSFSSVSDDFSKQPRTGTIFDEVEKIIELPEFDGKVSADIDSLDLGSAIEDQLEMYVITISSMYRDNHFHSFEHASHVVNSVIKLMSRIVAPDKGRKQVAETLHDHTYGITSDPLTQFACVLSALIHDVDHSGVPNTQLMKENPALSSVYRHRSVAEQNSIDLAWDLLMDDQFSELRSLIYKTEKERSRFRQMIVNSVMATDIIDADMKKLRSERWEKAFSGVHSESKKAGVNRKATIVIEHLIQASDVSHTMQHWQIYRKWNEQLFKEMYTAYLDGRADKNPADDWYEGEIGFFDFYILPLARKLKDCGVFGVSSDEYLTYAMKNRDEWKTQGRTVVAEMVERAKKTNYNKQLVTKEQQQQEQPAPY